MTAPWSKTVHAAAVLVGARAVLIRGPSGAGKSRLALDLIAAPRTGLVAFSRLVGDDRVHLKAFNGRLLVRPTEALAGFIEVRGAGLDRLVHEPCAVVGLVVDLAAPEAVRLPQSEQRQVALEGIYLPRLAVAPGIAPLPMVLTVLNSAVYLTKP